ncbi:hypothetical protein KJ742_00905 [Patescibacteria group bacterium]|nr:hypothetical protein [Patescibacteria group bacterium]MBU1682482.1 hypothetical protein [Patescibacteria group bacterium]MBU1934702.1 hypothetical protein [Patescibacteria group bacterium]
MIPSTNIPAADLPEKAAFEPERDSIEDIIAAEPSLDTPRTSKAVEPPSEAAIEPISGSEQITPENLLLSTVDLDAFRGETRALVEEYVRKGALKTQEDVNDYAEILRKAREMADEEPVAGGMTPIEKARGYVRTATASRFGRILDVEKDSETEGTRSHIRRVLDGINLIH